MVPLIALDIKEHLYYTFRKNINNKQPKKSVELFRLLSQKHVF